MTAAQSVHQSHRRIAGPPFSGQFWPYCLVSAPWRRRSRTTGPRTSTASAAPPFSCEADSTPTTRGPGDGHGRWRSAPLAIALVVSSQPFILTIQSGQIDGIETGLIGLAAWALAQRRDGTAGVSLALALLKPQLLAATAPLLALRALARRRPRPLVTCAVATVALLVLSLVVRYSWLAPWLAEATGPRLGIARLLPTVWGLAADLTGSAAWGAVPAAFLVALVVRLGRRMGVAEGLALTTALSVALTPHAWSYDHLALVPAWVMLVGRAGEARVLLTCVVVGLASLMPWALYALALSRGTETLSALVPIATTVALALLARPLRPARNAADR